jgi:hypothetical protein
LKNTTNRIQSRSALAELLGPTFAELRGIAGGANDAGHRTWTVQDTHKLRQTLDLQNHFMFRGPIDKAEDGINQSQNIQPMNHNPTTWPGNSRAIAVRHRAAIVKSIAKSAVRRFRSRE